MLANQIFNHKKIYLNTTDIPNFILVGVLRASIFASERNEEHCKLKSSNMSAHKNMNRRSWLRSAGLIGAGLTTAPSLFGNVVTQESRSWYEGVRTWEQTLAFTPKMDKLKARLLANENPFGPSTTQLTLLPSWPPGKTNSSIW